MYIYKLEAGGHPLLFAAFVTFPKKYSALLFQEITESFLKLKLHVCEVILKIYIFSRATAGAEEFKKYNSVAFGLYKHRKTQKRCRNNSNNNVELCCCTTDTVNLFLSSSM